MSRIYRPEFSAWISLFGRDAEDFLHRITTAAVRSLDVGTGAPALILNSRGTIRSAFYLWKYGEQEFGLEVKSLESKNRLLQVLEELTFSEEMTLADVSELSNAWIFADPSEASRFQQALEEEIRVFALPEKLWSKNVYSAWGRHARLTQWLDPFPTMDVSEWNRLRIENLIPEVGSELSEEYNPLEAGAALFVAPNKGCYPGQEVIEKIISLGSPARRLAIVEFDSPPAPGPIYNLADPPTEVGTLTTVSSQSVNALAIVRKLFAKENQLIRLASGAQGTLRKIAPYA